MVNTPENERYDAYGQYLNYPYFGMNTLPMGANVLNFVQNFGENRSENYPNNEDVRNATLYVGDEQKKHTQTPMNYFAPLTAGLQDLTNTDQVIQQQPQFTPATASPQTNLDMTGFQKFYQDYGLNPLASELNALFDTKPNEKRIDRAKQVARVNALGNAMRSLADVLTPLMNGGNDNMLIQQHDQTQVRNSLDKYQSELDALDQKKDRYRAMMLNNKMKALDLYMGMQREEANKLWQSKEADRQMWNKFGMDTTMAGINQGYDMAKLDKKFGYDKEMQDAELGSRERMNTADNDMRWKISQAELAQKAQSDKLDYLALIGKQDEKTYTFSITGSKGQEVKGRDDQFNDIIVKLKELYNSEKDLPPDQRTVKDYDNIALLNTSIDGGTKKEIEKILVAQYWDKFYDETPEGFLVRKGSGSGSQSDTNSQFESDMEIINSGKLSPEEEDKFIADVMKIYGQDKVMQAIGIAGDSIPDSAQQTKVDSIKPEGSQVPINKQREIVAPTEQTQSDALNAFKNMSSSSIQSQIDNYKSQINLNMKRYDMAQKNKYSLKEHRDLYKNAILKAQIAIQELEDLKGLIGVN